MRFLMRFCVVLALDYTGGSPGLATSSPGMAYGPNSLIMCIYIGMALISKTKYGGNIIYMEYFVAILMD